MLSDDNLIRNSHRNDTCTIMCVCCMRVNVCEQKHIWLSCLHLFVYSTSIYGNTRRTIQITWTHDASRKSLRTISNVVISFTHKHTHSRLWACHFNHNRRTEDPLFSTVEWEMTALAQIFRSFSEDPVKVTAPWTNLLLNNNGISFHEILISLLNEKLQWLIWCSNCITWHPTPLPPPPALHSHLFQMTSMNLISLLSKRLDSKFEHCLHGLKTISV